MKMIAAELRGGNKPSLNEALGWIGSRVDDIYGAGVGRLEDVWIDPGTGAPRWLLVKEGRFGGRSTLVPFERRHRRRRARLGALRARRRP